MHPTPNGMASPELASTRAVKRVQRILGSMHHTVQRNWFPRSYCHESDR